MIAYIGTFDHYRVRANVGEVFDSGWRYYLSGHYDEHDGYRDHNAKKHSSVLGRVGYDSKNSSVELEMSHYDSRVDIAGSLTLEEFEQKPRQANSFNGNDYMHDMSTVARLGVDHQLNESWFLDIEIDYTDTQVNNRNWDARTEHERTRLAVEPKLMFYHRLSAGQLQVTHGIDLAQNKTRYNWGRENKQSIIAVYAEAQIPLLKKLSGLIGGRYSKSKEDLTDAVIYPQKQSMDQSANAFSLALSYQVSKDQNVYLKAEDNFRFAKVDEQAYTSPTVIGLKPQKGRSYELGWHLKHKQHQLQMDLYRLELEDEIVWDPLAPKPIGSQFEGANVNADSSRRLGVGVDWLWNMNSSLIVGAEYDYVDAIHTKGSYRDYAISGVSEHTARAHADISITDYWSLFLETIFTGSRYPEGDGFNQTQKISSYTLVNAALQYRRKEWLAGIRADNLFDKDYISASYFSPFGSGYYVGTGARVRLDVSYRF